MVRLTTNTIFLLLLLFVLAIFFYNVVHFSTGLLATKYEEKIRTQKEEIRRLNKQIFNLESDKDTTATTAATTTKINYKQNINTEADPSIAIIIMACDRSDYLNKTLERLFEYKPQHFPVFVSQGCADEGVASLLRDDYDDKVIALKHTKRADTAYFAIAQHYGWALNQIFSVMNFDAVIFVEDDLYISPDFFNYFSALYPVLKSDPSLYCVSSWNDNGMSEVVEDEENILRTDVFPGLGWMMLKSLWEEVKETWPNRYWDEFMRLPEVRKNRTCLFPEISRNKNIGEKGTSDRQFWDKISRIKFNEKFVNFTDMDMSYLFKDKYDAILKSRILKSKIVEIDQVKEFEHADLRINYESLQDFRHVAARCQIMDDEKHGMPRTSYKGILSFYHFGNHIFLTPSNLDLR